jgi:integral membrane sensor domain MASE1
LCSEALRFSVCFWSAQLSSGFLSGAGQDYPLKFICIPFVVWVAFELRPREAALAMLAFSVVAIGSALHAARAHQHFFMTAAVLQHRKL